MLKLLLPSLFRCKDLCLWAFSAWLLCGEVSTFDNAVFSLVAFCLKIQMSSEFKPNWKRLAKVFDPREHSFPFHVEYGPVARECSVSIFWLLNSLLSIYSQLPANTNSQPPSHQGLFYTAQSSPTSPASSYHPPHHTHSPPSDLHSRFVQALLSPPSSFSISGALSVVL